MSCPRAPSFVIGALGIILASGPAFAADDPPADVERLTSDVQSLPAVDQRNIASGVIEILRGRKIFRYDTFGDEAFWGETLGLHRAIAGKANGGVGAGLSPKAALELGLKVDVNALAAPAAQRSAPRAGRSEQSSRRP